MITLYHNPRCSKSRQALVLLQENGIQPHLRLYLETPPTAAELKDLLAKLKLSARELLRKNEDDYKTLKLGDENLSEAALIKAMATHPKLIERPIAVKGNSAVIGRPPENLLSLL